MKNLLRNDMFLRIASLVIAILCWVYIIFITNPEIEVEITDIPITLADHQSIKKSGYVVSNEIDSTVDIVLKGTRQMLANLNRDNIIAYIDLSGCTKKDTYKLPVNIKLPYEEVTVTDKSVYNLTIAVDNYISRYFKINHSFSGELKDENHSVESIELSADTVNVYGPEDMIKTIEEATITIPLDRASDNIDGTASVKLWNSNGAEIQSSLIDIKDSEIQYECIVYKEKSVNVTPVFDDTSKIKYTVKDYPKVTVSGPAAEVDKIKSINTAKITYNEEGLPSTHTAKLEIPKNIEIEEKISRVEVLVESK